MNEIYILHRFVIIEKHNESIPQFEFTLKGLKNSSNFIKSVGGYNTINGGAKPWFGTGAAVVIANSNKYWEYLKNIK